MGVGEPPANATEEAESVALTTGGGALAVKCRHLLGPSPAPLYRSSRPENRG